MKNLQKEYGLYINGKWQPASDGATFKTYSPATGEELAVCAEATREDVDAAVKLRTLRGKAGRTPLLLKERLF